MAQGEEGFIDANHNGVLDPGEIFVDQGDPFIDANDDGVYGQIYPNGPWEPRFCGATASGTCPAYQGPNGQWDANTIIWKPTWVVFTGVPLVSTTPPGGAAPASDYNPSCLIGPSATGAPAAAAFAPIYVYDVFLNTPTAGSTWAAPIIVSQSGTAATLSIKQSGFFKELDGWGAMGSLGLDFEYKLLAPNGTQCVTNGSTTAGTPCVEKLLFRNFDDGLRGAIELDALKSATTSCTAPNNVTTQIQITVNGVNAIGDQSASVAP
jgi:hypothetical protein